MLRNETLDIDKSRGMLDEKKNFGPLLCFASSRAILLTLVPQSVYYPWSLVAPRLGSAPLVLRLLTSPFKRITLWKS